MSHSLKNPLEPNWPQTMPLPKDRTYEALLRHFEVERSIAGRLKTANQEERKQIYATMYDELFAAVPDHPRLTRRGDAKLTQRANQHNLRLIASFLKPTATLVEFGAGDCHFAHEISSRVAKVYAVDICDQIEKGRLNPPNFELIIYNGYDLPIPDNSIDIVFSNQLIEHLHPDDVECHFLTAHKMLREGGLYLMSTPHRLTGPHDISRYFSDQAEGFHLREWTYGDLDFLLRGLGYRKIVAFWFGRGRRIRVPVKAFKCVELVISHIPPAHRKGRLRHLLPGVAIAAYK